MEIRLAGLVPESIVDGPGYRLAVFVQGCPHACVGCHNPHTHDFAGGHLSDTDEIIAAIAIGNLPSVRVAEKLGMEYVCEYLRPAESGVPHALYSLKRSKFQ